MLDTPPHHDHAAHMGGEPGLLESYLSHHQIAARPEDRPVDAARALGMLRERGNPLGDLDPAALRSLAHAHARAPELLARRKPPLFDGDLELITAAPHDPALASRWAPFTTGEVRPHPVDAEHAALLSAPALDTVGPMVARLLNARTTEGGPPA